MAFVARGVSYGPAPCKARCVLLQDDFMCPATKPQWGSRYRGDLHVIKALGANFVRLYGNNPQFDHSDFLDQAHSLSLKVVLGNSDWGFTQSPDNCQQHSDFNCFTQVKTLYSTNLHNGLLLPNGSYHPAVMQVVVINEPDLKLPSIEETASWCRGIISAADGMIAAEKEAGVTGALVNFTVAFSFGVCSSCSQGMNTVPALAQMLQLQDAFLHPNKYGYTPHNNLQDFYAHRFENSFNTNNPAKDIKSMFLDFYKTAFPITPVSIQEYHCPYLPKNSIGAPTTLVEDLQQILQMAHHSDVLKGISFFEYQVRYDKGGSELQFGLFGLESNYSFGSFDLGGAEFQSWCLTPVLDEVLQTPVASQVTTAFGGLGVDYSTLCIPDPTKVGLDEVGFDQIGAQNDSNRMALFVERLVQHQGGQTIDKLSQRLFSERYATPMPQGTFAMVLTEIAQHPSWATWDPYAACVADRLSTESAVAQSIATVCSQMRSFNCSSIPASCSSKVFDVADYAFSLYYVESGGPPMENCYFAGAAVFADNSAILQSGTGCAVTKDAQTTALTSEGYQAILSRQDVSQTTLFVTRLVSQMGGQVLLPGGPSQLAANPPSSFLDLQTAMKASQWFCGPGAGLSCPTTSMAQPSMPASATTGGPGIQTSAASVPETTPEAQARGFDPMTFALLGAGLGVALLLVVGAIACGVRRCLTARGKKKRQGTSSAGSSRAASRGGSGSYSAVPPSIPEGAASRGGSRLSSGSYSHVAGIQEGFDAPVAAAVPFPPGPSQHVNFATSSGSGGFVAGPAPGSGQYGSGLHGSTSSGKASSSASIRAPPDHEVHPGLVPVTRAPAYMYQPTPAGLRCSSSVQRSGWVMPPAVFTAPTGPAYLTAPGPPAGPTYAVGTALGTGAGFSAGPAPGSGRFGDGMVGSGRHHSTPSAPREKE